MFQFELVSGHVFRREGARGPVWYAKYRLADGQQVQKRIGPAWTQRGRPADGYFTKRSAEGRLRELLEQARQGLIVRTGVLFVPVVVGGTSFLPPVTEETPLGLIETRTFGSHVIYERYGRVRDESE